MEVAGCEIQGVVPAWALVDSAKYYLQLHELDPSKVTEFVVLERMGLSQGEGASK